MKRTIILGVILILIFSNLSFSTAVDDSMEIESFEDYDDDVLWIYARFPPSLFNIFPIQDVHRCGEYPNVNIIQVGYESNNRNITASITVEGIIEDKSYGDVNNGETVAYSLTIYTLDSVIIIVYGNNTIVGLHETENITSNVSYSILNDSTISFSFSLNSSSEVIEKVIFNAGYVKIEPLDTLIKSHGYEYYVDFATIDKYQLDIEITKPTDGLYCFNRNLIPVNQPIILGPIQVEITELLNQTTIDYLELYIDNVLVSTGDNNIIPLIWKKMSFGRHNVKVIAFDVYGNRATDEIEVIKIF